MIILNMLHFWIEVCESSGSNWYLKPVFILAGKFLGSTFKYLYTNRNITLLNHFTNS